VTNEERRRLIISRDLKTDIAMNNLGVLNRRFQKKHKELCALMIDEENGTLHVFNKVNWEDLKRVMNYEEPANEQ